MRSNTSSNLLSRAIPIVFISAAFFIGSLAGLLFAASVSGSVENQLRTYLIDLLTVAENEGLTATAPQTIFFHARWIALGFLGCIGTVGCVWIPIVVALRGFLISFSICCFARFIGPSGILFSVALIGLPALFWIPIFFFLCVLSMKLSLEKAKLIFPNTAVGFNLRTFAFFGLLMFSVCILIECVFIPALLPVLVRTLR